MNQRCSPQAVTQRHTLSTLSQPPPAPKVLRRPSSPPVGVSRSAVRSVAPPRKLAAALAAALGCRLRAQLVVVFPQLLQRLGVLLLLLLECLLLLLAQWRPAAARVASASASASAVALCVHQRLALGLHQRLLLLLLLLLCSSR